jgi:predicted nucleic acid-binding protein
MNDKFFLDTNIFIYCFDETQPMKQTRSFELIARALHSGEGMVSTQVIQEFLNVATRKFKVPLKLEDAKIFLEQILYPICEVFPDLDLYRTALEVSRKTGYAFYDALILTGAIRGGCSILYSEDLAAGQVVDLVRIVNPY